MYTLRRSHFRSVVSVTIFSLIGFLFTLYRLSTRGFHLLQKQVQFFLSSFVSERCERIPRFYFDIWRNCSNFVPVQLARFNFCSGKAGSVQILYRYSWFGPSFVLVRVALCKFCTRPVQPTWCKFCTGTAGSMQGLF